MLSERLRNLEPRLRNSEAFFSSAFRLNHSNETPITIPVKKTNANANQRRWPSARRLLKTVVAMALEKTVVAKPLGSDKTFSSNHFLRIGVMRGISRRPQIPNRNGLSHLDIEPYWLAHWHSHPAELMVKPDHTPAPKNPTRILYRLPYRIFSADQLVQAMSALGVKRTSPFPHGHSGMSAIRYEIKRALAPPSSPMSRTMRAWLQLRSALGRDHLTAQLACGVGLGVHVHVPFARCELLCLLGRQRGLPADRISGWGAPLS